MPVTLDREQCPRGGVIHAVANGGVGILSEVSLESGRVLAEVVPPPSHGRVRAGAERFGEGPGPFRYGAQVILEAVPLAVGPRVCVGYAVADQVHPFVAARDALESPATRSGTTPADPRKLSPIQ